MTDRYQAVTGNVSAQQARRNYVVYALVELSDFVSDGFVVRYIGMTSNVLSVRLGQHLRESRITTGFDRYNPETKEPLWLYRCYCNKCHWLRSINADNVRIIPLKWRLSEVEARSAEADLIALFKGSGLVNKQGNSYPPWYSDGAPPWYGDDYEDDIGEVFKDLY